VKRVEVRQPFGGGFVEAVTFDGAVELPGLASLGGRANAPVPTRARPHTRNYPHALVLHKYFFTKHITAVLLRNKKQLAIGAHHLELLTADEKITPHRYCQSARSIN
jgi:hypothetical protein